MHLSIVAVGSHGDVQPYLALGLGLQEAGYQVQLCADRIFEPLVSSTGLSFTPVTAAPVDMMQQNLSRLGGPVKLMGWLKRHFKPLAIDFFSDLERVTRHTDAILYSTLAFAGYHVAEKQGVPALAVYNVPISPTHAFHNPSFPPPPGWLPYKGSYNWWSFRAGNQIFINLIKPIVNQCRHDVLGLAPLPYRFFHHLDVLPLPVVYGFSPNLLPRPADWGDWLKVSGHWFPIQQESWQPSSELLRFLDACDPPIYIGFGSMVDQQIDHATRIVLQALKLCGQRAILFGGWGGLGRGNLPDSIIRIRAAPHQWLFPHVAAIVHHGGAGTTATGLRYGKPTVVVPFFADQPFWGRRVHQLGCGPQPIPFAKLNALNLASAIDTAVKDPGLRQNAEIMGEKLQNEHGVDRAISMITGFLSSSRSPKTPD